MIHHISIGVSGILRAGKFYDATLGALGYKRVWEDLRPGERNQAIGYGLVDGQDLFTIKERYSENLNPGPGFHLAFSASSKESVDHWHEIGLTLGGKDKGSPKLWTEFGPDYYAAYLVDPDGWQLEAVYKTV